MISSCLCLSNNNIYGQDKDDSGSADEFFFGDEDDGDLFFDEDTNDVILEEDDEDDFMTSEPLVDETEELKEIESLTSSAGESFITEYESMSEEDGSEEELFFEDDEDTFDPEVEVETATTSTEETTSSADFTSNSNDVSDDEAVEMDAKALKKNKKAFIKGQKKIVKSYKKLTPEEIVNLQEELDARTGAIERLESELSTCKRNSLSLTNEVNTIKAQLDRALSDITELKASPTVAVDGETPGSDQPQEVSSTSSSGQAPITSIEGIVFKVQLGAYQQFDLGKQEIAGQPIEVDNASGWKKYTAGAFGNYAGANEFKEQVYELGMTDAFIVAYKDGVRIDMQSAIQGSRGQ
ncbi:MAG: hypothetical protein JKX95_02475 [Bacteroidia bacterium]|nr:hypothetical protein [Bacteroidia bacterium]